MKGKILKLNKYYFPVSVSDYKEIIKNIFSEAVYPIDIVYELNEDGSPNMEEIAYFQPIKTWDEWSKLEIRDFDESIKGVKGSYRMPSVVICADYSKIKWNKVVFPTKQNIWQRDNYICQYTGKKLNKETVTVDHIVPKSRGGKDCWFNLVAADREVNRVKADRTPEECGLKLIRQPFIPKTNALSLTFLEARPEWTKFIPEKTM